MPKSTKRFTISDESVFNEYGFRVLTSGIDIGQYRNNPILLWMHQRPQGKHTEEVLPLGYMDDLMVEGGRLTGIPVFDDSDEFAMKIFAKVENGTLRMCSPGLIPLMWSDCEEDLLPEQPQPTLYRCRLREVSIVDIGGNDNALALYDDQDNVINLASGASFEITNIKTNKKMVELKEVAELLQLQADDTNLIALVTGKVKETQQMLVTLKSEKDTAEANAARLQIELDGLKAAADNAKIISLVDAAVTAKKITAVERDNFIKLAGADYDTTKALLEGMKAYEPVSVQLTTGNPGDANAVELQELLKLSARDLYMQGKFERLKVLSPEQYKVKYKEWTGQEPA